MNQHVDMMKTIEPKSDQLNADDLIGRNLTITITKVSANEGSPEQPISVSFEGDNRKPYKPCKSMRRVMVAVWGADASKYVGRSMTLYRDPAVAFGGMQVGGIRISHMSHIEEKKTMALTATRAKRAPFTVHPMPNAPKSQGNPDDAADKWASAYIAKLETFETLPALEEFENQKAAKLSELETARPELHQKVAAAIAACKATFGGTGFADDDLADEPTREEPEAPNEPTAAEVSVAKVIEEMKAAKTSAALEKIIKGTEAHRMFMPEDCQIKLDIAVSQERNRFETADAK